MRPTSSHTPTRHGGANACLFRGSRIAGVAVALGVLLSLALPSLEARAAAPAFVQTRRRRSPRDDNSQAFTNANTAGNLIVAYVIWSNTERGDAVRQPRQHLHQRGRAHDVGKQLELPGLLRQEHRRRREHRDGDVRELDQRVRGDVHPRVLGRGQGEPGRRDAQTATGTGSAMSSGAVTTTNANDLLFAAGASTSTVTAGGSGYTTRSTAFGNRTQDRNVTAAGSYNATVTQNSSAWVMQLVAFKADSGSSDTTPPTVSITAPANNAQVSDIVNVMADASDDVGRGRRPVPGRRTSTPGVEDTTAPYALAWDTRTWPTARTRSRPGPATAPATRSCPRSVNVNVANASSFQNEVLATGFDLPTAIKFLPDGRMLVVELQGKIKVLPPPYTTPDPDAVPAADQHRLRRRAAGHLRHRARPELRHQPLLLHLLHARVRRTGTACRGSPPTRRSPARSPAASWCSTRIRRTPTPSTTAAR